MTDVIKYLNLPVSAAPTNGDTLTYDGATKTWVYTTAAAALGAGAVGAQLVDAETAAAARTAVGLSNVDNTADLAKPVSTATQAALDGKQSVGYPITMAMKAGGDLTTVDANANGSFPARPTSRTDVRVWWYGNANTTAAHASAIAALDGDEYVPWVAV